MVEELRARGRHKDGARLHDGEVSDNIWFVLKRRVEARRPAARKRVELIEHVHAEWALISMHDISAQ